MTANYMNELFDIIKCSLWGGTVTHVSSDLYNEMKAQAIVALPANILALIDIPNEVRAQWEKDILFQVSYNIRYKHQQANLPINVPYVVLKGTSAAQYYPYPDYRTMGDIDIMTSRENYNDACDELVKNGYKDITGNHTREFGRHRCFEKSGIIVEVHAFFALLNDPSKAEWMDNTIIESINPSHVLPDMQNGLVLLEHVNQHMEEGIGLRQIIDWMMFVDKCLKTDESWKIFQKMAIKIGLETLALTTTRMCEIYFGLYPHTWCQKVDVSICEQLMDYIFSCGNFGIKHKDESHTRVQALTYTRTPIAALRYIQARGIHNWNAAKKCYFFRLFAWIYQILRYIKKGHDNSSKDIMTEYVIAKERRILFDALGITQSSKGHAILKNNKYIKTYKKP